MTLKNGYDYAIINRQGGNMKENIKSLFIIVLGNLLLTSAYAFLTVPNNIINGGVTSTSLLLSYYFHVDIGYVVTILIILLLFFGRVMLGKDFFYRSLFSSACYMVFFNLFHMTGISFTFSPIVIVVLAGIFVGVGRFLCLMEDSSTVGYDAFALYIHEKHKRLETSDVLCVIELVIILSGFATFGILSVIYGIIFTIIETQIMYFLEKGYKVPIKKIRAIE